MNKNTALIVAGIIFSLVTLAHLFRIIFKFELILAGWSVPIWFNVIGFLIALILAIWMFAASKS